MKAKINDGKRKDGSESPLASLKRSIDLLTIAINETEASRKRLHEAGQQCWVDRFYFNKDDV